MPNWTNEIQKIMSDRFGHDTLLALATVDSTGMPSVRTVNAFYENGAFYIITYALSSKMQQIRQNSAVAVCGDWFSAHGIASCLGYVCAPENLQIANKLRLAFSSWYDNGHINEKDPNTCILKISITDGVLFSDGMRYSI